ncbi:MAG: hypothetical protein FJX56_03805 [Alphaproteobacteria bacterium]|nr:hypothetical protein [Alphaproteobacteria bacterium]
MPPRRNPLKLNPLQCRTLAILQAIGAAQGPGTHDAATGEVAIAALPDPHGDHFHVGDAVVAGRDATGLTNEGVWKALDRKGLARANFPFAIRLTVAGLAYDTGIADSILHRAGR